MSSKKHTNNHSRRFKERVYDSWTYGVIDNDINTEYISTINIKQYYSQQDVDKIVKLNIENIFQVRVDVVIFIHGYGSHGTQAKIHDWCRQTLSNLKAKNPSLVIIPGEDFSIFNYDALYIKNKYKELELFLQVCNHGATIIFRR